MTEIIGFLIVMAVAALLLWYLIPMAARWELEEIERMEGDDR